VSDCIATDMERICAEWWGAYGGLVVRSSELIGVFARLGWAMCYSDRLGWAMGYSDHSRATRIGTILRDHIGKTYGRWRIESALDSYRLVEVEKEGADDAATCDAVNSPAHYVADRKYHPADVIEDWQLDRRHNVASAIEYLARLGRKGGSEHEVEDLRKAIWRLEREVALLKRRGQ